MYGKGTTTNKQYKKGQKKKKKTYYWTKRRCLLSCRPYLDVQKVEIINKSDVLEDIRKIIITGFGIKAVQK